MTRYCHIPLLLPPDLPSTPPPVDHQPPVIQTASESTILWKQFPEPVDMNAITSASTLKQHVLEQSGVTLYVASPGGAIYTHLLSMTHDDDVVY